MHELTRESTTPPPPPPYPIPFTTPSTPPPPEPLGFDLGEQSVFRESFLFFLTLPGIADSMRLVGAMLYNLALASYGAWPAWPETPMASELRAIARDLRHVHGLLDGMGKARQGGNLECADIRLSILAPTWAQLAARLVERIEEALGPAPVVKES